MVDSIHNELWKPSTAAAETSKITAKRRAKNRHRPVRKKRKIDTKSALYPSGIEH